MSRNKKEFSAIITSAGNSTRMGKLKKEYLPFPSAASDCGENFSNTEVSVISENVFKFLKTEKFNAIIITVPKKDLQEKIAEKIIFSDKRITPELQKSKTILKFVEGGKTRQESVANGLAFLEELNNLQKLKTNFVLIHDGARPWASAKLINRVCKQTREKGSAIPAINSVDTQKIVDSSCKIITHLTRAKVFSVQTPQGFNFEKLLAAHKLAENPGSIKTEDPAKKEYTDDSEIYALIGEEVFICEGEVQNKKITYKEDLGLK